MPFTSHGSTGGAPGCCAQLDSTKCGSDWRAPARISTASATESRYPLEEEPLVHNNSVLPMEWSGLDRPALRRLKELARSLSPRA